MHLREASSSSLHSSSPHHRAHLALSERLRIVQNVFRFVLWTRNSISRFTFEARRFTLHQLLVVIVITSLNVSISSAPHLRLLRFMLKKLEANDDSNHQSAFRNPSQWLSLVHKCMRAPTESEPKRESHRYEDCRIELRNQGSDTMVLLLLHRYWIPLPLFLCFSSSFFARASVIVIRVWFRLCESWRGSCWCRAKILWCRRWCRML